MKKLVLALLVGLMVVATAGIASAEITVGGQLEIRYDLWDDLNLNNHANDRHNSNGTRTQSFWADRVLLNVDAKIAEGLEAFVELDTLGTERAWGHNTLIDGIHSEPFGIGIQGNVSNPSKFVNRQGEQLAIRQAWINFMIPGAPVGLKIGHQPLALGHGIFLDTHRQGSDSLLLYSKPVPELLLAGVYIKGFEGAASQPGVFLNSTNDIVDAILQSGDTGTENFGADFYAAIANFTFMPNNTVGMNFTYVHDDAIFKSPLVSVLEFGAPFTNILVTAENVELTLDGVVGPVTYKGEVNYLHVDASRIFGAGGPGKDYTVNAWAAMMGAGAKLGPANLAMEVAYGTGNNRKDANVIYNPGGVAAMFGDNNDHAYATPYGATSYNYAFLYNDKIGQGPFGSAGGAGFGDGFGGFGLANTGYIKVSAGVTPMDKLNAGLDVLYLRASEPMIKDQSRDLGWEVDAHADYKIYDNLNLNLTGGVFVPGPWYKFKGVSASTSTSQLLDEHDSTGGLKRDLAYGMETKLTVKF